MTALPRVGDLAEQIRGVTYAKEDATSEPRPGYLPVLRAGNITEDGLVFDDLVFVPAERVAASQKIRRHDVLIATSSGSLDVVGKAARALADFEGGFGAFCKVLRPGPGIDPAYFAHFFRTRAYRQRISAMAAGANINNLRSEHLDELTIPVPPLVDQQRIADILDKADALRARRRAAFVQLDTLARSIFLDLFGDPSANPKGWEVRTFDQTMRDETSRAEKLQRSDYLPEGRYPVVDQGQSVIAGYCDDEHYLCPSDPPVVVFGDHTRAVKLVRHRFVVGADGAKVLAPQPGVDAVFLSYLMRAMPIPELGYSRHMREVKRLSFPIPPMVHQHQFAVSISAIDQHRDAHERSRRELESLFASLQHRAFRGEL